MPPRTSPSALQAILGNAPALRAVVHRATLVAPTQTPVLVTGESGTGKELLARALHQLGPSPQGPLVTVNCGALPRELCDSELFGHERGAFTGAAASRKGWFEEASGGTLVLDEIGELPTDLQPRLLRVLETGRIRRVGGHGEHPVNVRIVASTLRDLRQDIASSRFRLDLFHRLAGFELVIPPLRDRRDDIADLAQHFLTEFEPELGARSLTHGAMAALVAHDWPGNVRELRNVIRRAAIMSGGQIDAAALGLDASMPCGVRMATAAADGIDTRHEPISASDDRRAMAKAPLVVAPGDLLPLAGKTFAQIESDVFLWALRQHAGSRRRAARALGVCRSTFCDRLRRHFDAARGESLS